MFNAACLIVSPPVFVFAAPPGLFLVALLCSEISTVICVQVQRQDHKQQNCSTVLEKFPLIPLILLNNIYSDLLFNCA